MSLALSQLYVQFVPESKRFLDLIWVYGKPNWKKLKSKCFVWLKPTSFVVSPQWESTFGITELVNPSRSFFLKKNWEDHKKNQNPNRVVCFKTSIKLTSGLHLNISIFLVTKIWISKSHSPKLLYSIWHIWPAIFSPLLVLNLIR